MSFSTQAYPDVRKGRNWKKVETSHFDIWFNGAEADFGGEVAQFAEYHMKDLCHLLDYKPRSRFVLHVFSNPESYWHSSLYRHPQTLPQGGVTLFDGNAASVFYQKGKQALYRQVREAATALLMHEIYYGQTVQFSLQQQMLIDLPEFFRFGIPAWEAEGWTTEDEDRMRSLSARNYVSLTLTDKDPDMTRTLQKSVWHYIAQKFGPVKVYSIMYMTRVSRSVQSGIITVLGVSMETFTDRWREYYVQKYQGDVNTRRNLSKEAKAVSVLPKGYRLCQAKMQPGGEKVAAVGEKKGIYTLFLTDFRSGKQEQWKLPGGMKSHYREIHQLEVPMSWDYAGKNVCLVLTQGTSQILLTFSLDSKSIKKRKLPGALEQIHGLDWNHEKGWMTFTGSRKGQSDLFMLEPEGNLIQLTNDAFDESYPMWSYDEQNIFFSTNRRPDSILSFEPKHIDQDLDIWRFSLSEDRMMAVTQSVLSDEIPLFQLNSYELNYLTQESGITGLGRRNLFQGDSLQLTAFDVGIRSIQVSGGRAFITAWNAGKLSAFTLENPAWNKGLRPQLTELQKEKRKEAAEKEKNRKDLDSETEKEEKPEIPEMGELIQVTPSDSSESKKPLKYYVFDEDDVPVRRPQTPRSVGNQPGKVSNVKKLTDPLTSAVPLNWQETEVNTPKNPSIKRTWYLRELGTQMAFDPIFRFHYNLYAKFSDIHRQHEAFVLFRPYLQFRNSDFQMGWEWKKHRLQPGASFQRAIRFYDRQGFELRYTLHSYKAWVGYGLNRSSRITGGLRMEALWRQDLSLNTAVRYSDEAWMPGGFIRLDYDYTLRRENFIQSGQNGNIRIDHYLITGNKRADPLTMVQADFRKYLRFMKESVLALRFTGGFSLGEVKPLMMMGGVDNWLNSRIQNPGEIPVPTPTEGLWLMQIQSPVRGFPYNARNGRQYLAMNAEVRIPLLKYLTKRLNSDPLYNFQWVFFYDVGTVWTTGNPLSQRNPVNTVTIEKNPFIIQVQSMKSPFLSGAGTGFRMSVMRYILRLDFAMGMEDGTIAKPQFSISLGSDF